jgi:hypothetical protein
MSQKPLSLSPDLKRLREEGYFVQIRGGLLLLREVPYVNANSRFGPARLFRALRSPARSPKSPTRMSCILMVIIRAPPTGSQSARSSTRVVK